MLLSVILVWLFSRTRYTVERWEGGLLLVIYIGYLVWLITNL
jgi:cation:H+ antiporter